MDSFEKAKRYAFLLLKYRLRSENELALRLKRKRFDTQTTTRTIEFLKAKGFLDDKAFAGQWVNWRLKNRMGPERIKRELKFKGVDREIIEEQINRAKEIYPQQQVVSELLEERMRKLKGLEPVKAKKRVYGYLVRKGFSPSFIIEAFENYDR